MAHRSFVDLLMGRHYCPSCGKAAGFKQDYSYNKAKIRWYRLAPIRLSCNSCGVQVQGSLRPGIWAALLIWGVVVIASLVIIRALTGNDIISGPVAQVGSLILVGVAFVSGLFMFQVFLHYKVAGNAP